MTNTAKIRFGSPEGQGCELLLAVLSLESTVLTPAQRQLRRMVVESVQARTSKLAYGAALDALFASPQAVP